MDEKERLDALFTAAIQAHHAAMYRLAYTMLRNAADAEDAASAAILLTYQAARRIRDWNAIKPYLMQVTVNACHATLRKRKKETVAELNENTATAPDETPIWVYIHQLPLNLRVVLQLRYGEGMPIKDISKALRIPQGTVSTRLTRGQKMLREQMEKEGAR